MTDSLFSAAPDSKRPTSSSPSIYTIDSIPRDLYETSQGLFLQPYMLNDFQANCCDLARTLAQTGDDYNMSRNPPRLKRDEYGVLMIDRALGRRRGRRNEEEKSESATTLAERDQPVMHTEEKVALPQQRPKGNEDEITLTEIDEGAGGEHFYGQDTASTDDADFWARYLSRRGVHVVPDATTTTKVKDSRLKHVKSRLKYMWRSDKKNKKGRKESGLWKRVSRESALTENQWYKEADNAF